MVLPRSAGLAAGGVYCRHGPQPTGPRRRPGPSGAMADAGLIQADHTQLRLLRNPEELYAMSGQELAKHELAPFWKT
jgi:hypothetical protein